MQKNMLVASIRILSIITGLFYIKYYTNNLSIAQIGIFFYLGTLSYILNALVFVPIDSYMQARISNIEKLPYIALKNLIIKALLTALFMCVLLSLPLVLMGHLSPSEVPLLYLMAAFLYLCTSIRNLLNIRGYLTFSTSMVLFESLARLIVFIFFSAIFEASAQALLLSSIVALFIEFIILFYWALKVLPLSFLSVRLDGPFTILKSTTLLAGCAVSNTVQLQSYKLILPSAGYLNTSGALGVVSNIGAVAMSSCAQVFSQLFTPRLYKSNGASVNEYVGWGSLMALMVLIIGLLLSNFLVLNLTKSDYLPYASLIGVGVVIEASNMIVGAYSIYLLLHGKIRPLFLIQLIGALLSLVGCFISIIWFPYSPVYVGLVIAGSQILVVFLLMIYIYDHKLHN